MAGAYPLRHVQAGLHASTSQPSISPPSVRQLRTVAVLRKHAQAADVGCASHRWRPAASCSAFALSSSVFGPPQGGAGLGSASRRPSWHDGPRHAAARAQQQEEPGCSGAPEADDDARAARSSVELPELSSGMVRLGL